MSLNVARLTFYLAASGERWPVARARGAVLAEFLGYAWAYDWTQGVEAHGRGGLGLAPEARQQIAEADLCAARHADLFVALLDAPHTGRGTFMELGARLGASKVAHVVGGEDHLFWAHPLVRRHADWGAFLRWLGAPEPVAEPGAPEAPPVGGSRWPHGHLERALTWIERHVNHAELERDPWVGNGVSLVAAALAATREE